MDGCCKLCDQPENADDLVQCDRCDAWFHFSCVGVSDSVGDPNRSFYCPGCAQILRTNQNSSKGKDGFVTGIETSKSRKSDSRQSVRSLLNLKKAEEESILRKKRLAEEEEIRAKQLAEEKLQLEEEERLLRKKEALRKKVLEEEKIRTLKRLEEQEKIVQERYAALYADLDEDQDDDQSSRSSFSSRSGAQKVRDWIHALGCIDDKPHIPDPAALAKEAFQVPTVPDAQIEEHRGAIPKYGMNVAKETVPVDALNWLSIKTFRQSALQSSTPVLPKKTPGRQIPVPESSKQVSVASTSSTSSLRSSTPWFPKKAAGKQNPMLEGPGHNAVTSVIPSAQQIAARHVMARELPFFDGNPEDWPIFFSCYKTTTEACGYSQAENLVRLQRSLKGQALEAVKSRLLLPASVPNVIQTLLMLYGRPEALIRSLINKLRTVPAPKSDRLDTLIDFGLIVQNLVDHIIAAEQTKHLANPVLLAELVEKLPANYKMEWACCILNNPDADLATFGSFMDGLVKAASTVTIYDDARAQGTKKYDKPKSKEKLYVHSQEESSHRSRESQVKEIVCFWCNTANHRVFDCEDFKRLDVESRWKAIRQKGLCRSCLALHGKWPCRSSRECEVQGCRLKHHTLLHSVPLSTLVSTSEISLTAPNQPTTNVALQNYHNSMPSTLFRIVPVTLHGENLSIETYAFLDDGSSLTMIEGELVDQLGIKGVPEQLCLRWTGDVSRFEKDSQRVQLTISGTGMTQRFTLRDVRTVNKHELPSQSLFYDQLVDLYPHLRGLPVRSYTDAVPRLLIGLDNTRLQANLKLREGRYSDPVAAKTRLGLCIYGKLSSRVESRGHVNYHACECRSTGDNQLQELVKQFFILDDANVTIKPRSSEEKRAQFILENTTVRVASGFETGLLWKIDNPEFPDSYQMALRRLQCLERRLRREPELSENVRQQIVAYQQKNYAHQATEHELATDDLRRVWYLPLGVVTNPRKPGKVRLIWDAAAKVDGISFNDMVLKGPDLLSALPDILLRFRQHNIAICADIREMFHRIRIREQDRPSQRFLWRDDPNAPPTIFVMDVATFGSTCSPSSAQFVKNKNAMEYAEQYSRAANAIVKNHYVDDFLDSVDTAEEAISLAEEVRFIHSKAGFEIRDFLSNSEEVLSKVGELEPALVKCLSLDKVDQSERVLGMQWVPKQDIFTFSTLFRPEIQKLLDDKTIPTKRQVLRTVMSLFDPLGLIAHFIVHGKVLIQDIWRSGTDWDEPIDLDIFSQWLRWTDQFQHLGKVGIPRCFFSGTEAQKLNGIQLHIFVDASESAYAAVAYLRIENSSVPRCILVGSKTKVAPLKPLSIPRLELQAALLGVRLMNSIRSALTLPLKNIFFWSDSSTVLIWLLSDSRRYHQFVAFRVGEILTTSDAKDWRYVPTKLNVADDATKWGNGPKFNPSDRWFVGPEFLHKTQEYWPEQPKFSIRTEEELRSAYLHHREIPLQPIVNVARFSKWERLLRTTALSKRAVRIFLKRHIAVEPIELLTTEELQEAENLLWTQAQKEMYPDEYALLKYNKDHPEGRHRVLEKSSPLYGLTPFIDDCNVIRLGGRIGAAPYASFSAKYPIILPKNHTVTVLLIDSYHRKYRHANRETVCNEMRQRFHISNLRRAISKVSENCQRCRVYKAIPKPPMMGSLPKIRLTPFIRPFTFTGVDYFGPMQVKVGRRVEKRWVALFTCLTVRAVHMEIVHSLSTNACIMAIRRFVARRGAPEEIHSDNGTNFGGASRQLTDQLKRIHSESAATFTNARTKWVFIPPAAPHMGGAWERMVRSVKTAMKCLEDYPRNPDDEALETIVCEAEAIVNSRPLTYIPIESADQEALTPNHFLMYGSNSGNQYPTEPVDNRAALRDNWKMVQHLVDEYWRRWVKEYMPMLTRRTKWFEPTKPLKPGDAVFVVDESARNSWVRGRILEVFPGSDGQVRQALVQTAFGLKKRPAVRLALLDIGIKSPDDAAIVRQLHGPGDVATGNDTTGSHL